MPERIVSRILLMSIQAGILILAVLILRRVTRKSLSPRLQYALWLVPALRLMLPFNFETRFSVIKAVPDGLSSAAGAVFEPYAEAYKNAADFPPGIAAAEPEIPLPAQPGPPEVRQIAGQPASLLTVLFWIWIAGAVLTAAYIMFINLRFILRTGKVRARVECGSKLPVYHVSGIASPCLAGLIKPYILINDSACKNQEIFDTVLKHELCHYKAGDQWWTLLRSLCCALHWFNPLVWLAAFLTRADCEKACDSRLMRGYSQSECERYGMVLLSIIRMNEGRKNLLRNSATMNGGKREMRERIRSIGKRPKTAWYAVPIAVLAVSAAAFAACSMPSEEKLSPAVEAENVRPENSDFPAVPPETAPQSVPEPEAAAPPDVFINTARADNEVLQALYSHFRGIRLEEDRFDRAAEEGCKICVYACRPFRSGMLAAADFYTGGEMTADLFYIENGAVQRFTAGSDAWGINYTRFMGSTIVYGKSFAWDNGIQASTHADAEFFNGDGESVSLICKEKDDKNRAGFIFISEGCTWLKSLRIYNGGDLVTDDGNYQFMITAPCAYEGALSILDRLHFNPMLDAAALARRYGDVKYTARLASISCGEAVKHSMSFYKDLDIRIADIWRSNNLRYDAFFTSPARDIKIKGPSAPSKLTGAYWAQTRLDDGTEAGIAACLGKAIDLDELRAWPGEVALKVPEREGRYVLIFETEDAYYPMPVIVQSNPDED